MVKLSALIKSTAPRESVESVRTSTPQGPDMAFGSDSSAHGNDVNLEACTFLVRPVAVGMPIVKKAWGHQWRLASCTS